MRARLSTVPLPDFGKATYPGLAGPEEFSRRLASARAAALANGWSHLIVYADREHFANLAWLTGLDPRFEEALLIAGPSGSPLLLTGVECESYLPISPLWKAGLLRAERWDDFSLQNIPREQMRSWPEIFAGEGIDAQARVGLAGWKSYRDPRALDAPHYLVEALRATGALVENAVPIFVDPARGLRTICGPEEIALFEWANVEASEGMKSLIGGLREGATDHELARLMQFNGAPQGCHWTLKTGPNRISLASAKGDVLRRGNTFSANICYWGANCCRAGWVAAGPEDLPEEARDYAESFAGPYVEALGEWFRCLRIGAPAGSLYNAIHQRLPAEVFGIKLNPGHLIHLDEWPCSPVEQGSTIPLRSGMIMQCDVIPSSKRYFSTRMEDSYLLADPALRSRLPQDVLDRCRARQRFMRDTLGFPLSDDVLPLSNLAGVVQPYLLRPDQIFTLEAHG
jgi:hypothetical protein